MTKRTTKGKASTPVSPSDPTKAILTSAGAKTNGVAGAIVTMDEETRNEVEKAVGTKNLSFNVNLHVRTAQTAYTFKGADIHAGAEAMLNNTATLVAIKAFKPTDPVEAMIAAQAVMLHNLAMEAGRRAQVHEQSSDVASKLRKDAANSARAMVDMTEALERRRGRGPQTIRVERVVVQDGGQAVVAGSVVGGASLPAAPATPSLGQGAPPMPMLDAEPVAVGVGEGS